MDIQALKSRLDIIEIAHSLGIKKDKNNKALCPFHEEKTPNLKFRRENKPALISVLNAQLATWMWWNW